MLFPLPLRAALILYHIQNRLSSTFFKFFQKFFLCRSLLRDSFNIISLSFLFVKYFFQVFSKSFFVISSALFRGNLIIISLFLSFVKPFLKSFFKTFSRFQKSLSARLCLPPGMDSAYSSSSFSLSKSKSNILLTLSRGPPRSTVMLLYTFSSSLSSKRMDRYILVFCVF